MNQIEMIAKNVRIQMKKRDVTETHVAHKLKLETDKLRGRLNGRVPFSDDELEILAPYLDTTFEALHADCDVIPEDKANKTAQPAAVQRPASVVPPIPGVVLIAETNKSEELRQLLLKTFMAKLTGKIDDLDYYVRNNLLMKVVKRYGGVVTEEEKLLYVEYCREEYQRWKDGLISDIDDVMEVALTANDVESVSAVVMPTGKGRLSQFMGWLVKDNMSVGIVDIELFSADVDRAIAHLAKVERLLHDYKNAQ